MTLADYLADRKIADKEFAEKIGVDRSNVSRMRTSNQIPGPDVMREIARVTEGAVTANDFYGIAA